MLHCARTASEVKLPPLCPYMREGAHRAFLISAPPIVPHKRGNGAEKAQQLICKILGVERKRAVIRFDTGVGAGVRWSRYVRGKLVARR